MAHHNGRAFAGFLFGFTLLALSGCGSGIIKACNAAGGCCLGVADACVAPRYVYANGIDGQVSAFPVDNVTGALTNPVSISGPTSSLGMAAINNQFLYVSDFGLGGPASIDAWSINLGTGALTPAPTFSLGTFSAAGGLASNNSAQVLYVGDAGKIDALKADPTTGALTAITGSPFPAGTNLFLTVDPQNRFVFASELDPPGTVRAFTIDSTGALTSVAGSPFPVIPNSNVNAQPGQIVVDSGGKFVYVTLVGTSQIAGFSIDASGALTPVPGSPFNTGATPLALATANKFLYVSNLADGTVSGYTIDPAAGGLTAIAGSPFPIRTGALTTDFFGNFLYASGTAGMMTFKIDATGVLTQVGSPVPHAGATVLTFVL